MNFLPLNTWVFQSPDCALRAAVAADTVDVCMIAPCESVEILGPGHYEFDFASIDAADAGNRILVGLDKLGAIFAFTLTEAITPSTGEVVRYLCAGFRSVDESKLYMDLAGAVGAAALDRV